MTKYTIVDEGYYVIICKSVEEVFGWLEGLCSEEDGDKQITLSRLRKLLSGDYSIARFYDRHEIHTYDDSDWYYRVQKHK